MEHLIYAKDLKFTYPDKTEVSVEGEISVKKNQRVTILGANGSGKTTLLKSLVGVIKPKGGDIRVLDFSPSKEFSKIRYKVGVVFQNADEQIIAPTVYDDIALMPRGAGIEESEIEKRVNWILTELNLLHLAQKVPHYLSGGEKKKVVLAGALVMNPSLLILDEPFTGLDPQSKQNLIEIINHFNEKHNTTVLTTTHDVETVFSISDYVYIFSDSGVIAEGKPLEVFSQPEKLQSANLLQPQIQQLFSQLIKWNLPLEQPSDVEDGANQIFRIYTRLLKGDKISS
ncbi:energy-coupling factor ABC transporter ATP-binding protein [Proteinivorax hydrogeniformans]|uniref:Energy-coupling factor ABC transporter ATP-binding protein n=1 Tax=Proteinivorax hydrogeniformans TaxID=1826727 RepID=A0AAU8HWI4_9FIRM